MPTSAQSGTRIKYVHARMPGRELVHLIPPDGLELDERFGSEEFVRGEARTLCGRRSAHWIVGAGGTPCRWCQTKR
jgi:hypothetical protein